MRASFLGGPVVIATGLFWLFRVGSRRLEAGNTSHQLATGTIGLANSAAQLSTHILYFGTLVKSVSHLSMSQLSSDAQPLIATLD